MSYTTIIEPIIEFCVRVVVRNVRTTLPGTRYYFHYCLLLGVPYWRCYSGVVGTLLLLATLHTTDAIALAGLWGRYRLVLHTLPLVPFLQLLPFLFAKAKTGIHSPATMRSGYESPSISSQPSDGPTEIPSEPMSDTRLQCVSSRIHRVDDS